MTKPAYIVLVLLALATAAYADGTDHTITIAKGEFNPQTITIHPGDTIVWVNNDDSDHTIVASDGSYQSGNLKHGDQYQHRFTTAGTFTYSDHLHPRMRATIVVK